jgi:hypothetical protein
LAGRSGAASEGGCLSGGFQLSNTKVRPTYHINCEIGTGNRLLDRDLGIPGGESFGHVMARLFCVKFGMRWREASFSFRRESHLLSRPTRPLTSPCFNMVRYSSLSLREWSESFSLRERQVMLPLVPPFSGFCAVFSLLPWQQTCSHVSCYLPFGLADSCSTITPSHLSCRWSLALIGA